MAKCAECNGTGEVEIRKGPAIEVEKCYICRGSGKLVRCPRCSGLSYPFGLTYPNAPWAGKIDGGKCPGNDTNIDGDKCLGCDDGVATYRRYSRLQGYLTSTPMRHEVCRGTGRIAVDCPRCSGRGYVPG
jgi:DnaJ-class molecular chaperone